MNDETCRFYFHRYGEDRDEKHKDAVRALFMFMLNLDIIVGKGYIASDFVEFSFESRRYGS